MAYAKTLRMEGGGCSTWGRDKREDGGWRPKEGRGGGCPQGALREGATRVLGGGGGSGLPTAGSRSTAPNYSYARAPDPHAHIKHTFYYSTDVYLLKFQTSHSTQPARENTRTKKVNFNFSSFFENWVSQNSLNIPNLSQSFPDQWSLLIMVKGYTTV
jgi:hypothetical protein